VCIFVSITINSYYQLVDSICMEQWNTNLHVFMWICTQFGMHGTRCKYGRCQGVCIVVCVWIACQQSATVNFVEIAIIFISDIQQPLGISSC
jgi:hypothetical protein